MFYSTNINSDNVEYLSSLIYPNQPGGANNRTTNNYTINVPYRLLFSSINLVEPDNFFSTCYISPEVTLYAQATKEETSSFLEKASLHKHDFFEFMFVLAGEVYVNIENERHLYPTGSCYILNKNVMHTEEYSSDFRIVFLQISTEIMQLINEELKLRFFNVEKFQETSAMSEFISNNLNSDSDNHKAYVDFIPQNNTDEITNTFHDYFDSITRESLNAKVGSTITILTILKKIFLFMSSTDIFSTTPVQIGSSAEYSVFSEIARLMNESKGRISRSQLSEKMNYSGSYLNEICKKYTGLSLFDYGMTFCMKAAAQMLTSSKDNITEIGYTLGFTNRTHFYKVFKSTYGITPAEYRRKHK